MKKDFKHYVTIFILIILGNIVGGILLVKFFEPMFDRKEGSDNITNNNTYKSVNKFMTGLLEQTNRNDYIELKTSLVSPLGENTKEMSLKLLKRSDNTDSTEWEKFLFEFTQMLSSNNKMALFSSRYDNKILNMMNIKKGDTICDLGPQMGYFVLPLSRLVGKDGTVYPTDINPNAENFINFKLQYIKEISNTQYFKDCQEEEREELVFYDNIKPQTNKIDDISLPEKSCNWILSNQVHNVAREFDRKLTEKFVESMKKSLKPGGKVLITEWLISSEGKKCLDVEKFKKRLSELGFRIEHEEVDMDGKRLILLTSF